MNPRAHPAPVQLALSVALLMAACSGGGGSSSAFDPGDVNEGTYSAAEFGFVDPHPPGFHPFGNDSVVLQPRDELAVFLGLGAPAGGRVLDDRLAGNGTLANLATVLGTPVIVAGGTGNVDLEGGDEIVALVDLGNPQAYTARIVKPATGGYQVVDEFGVPRGSGDVHVALGDVDGDHRDEILVTTFARLHVFDDREAGMTLLTTLVTPFSVNERPVLFDADGDGRDEIAFPSQSSSELYDDALAGVPFARIAILSSFLDLSLQELMVGDFDGDNRAELALVKLVDASGFVDVEFDVQLFGFVGTRYQRTSSQRILLRVGSFSFSLGVDDWQATALDSDGDGKDEIALVVPSELGGSEHHDLRLLRRTTSWAVGSPTSVANWGGVDSPMLLLCGADVDATGGEDLYVAQAASSSLRMRRITWSPSAVVTTMPNLSGVSGHPPLLVAGDFDADGTVLRYTGNKTLGMAEPIPLVLLTAAPTKTGIAQNYDATSTSYSVSSGSGNSIGVTTSSTWSISQGLHTPADELFGVGVSVEGSWETRWSDLETRHTTFVRGYSTGFQEDVVLFQGTLYLSYEYVIESARDPQLVGELMTFDFPLDAKTYKWTVDKFDTTFPDLALQPLLPHTIGDPTTYRDRLSVKQLVDDHVGWMSSDVIPVGATTGGSNSTAIELANESTSTTERTFSLTGEVEFSSIISSTRASSSTSRSDVYSVTVSESTTYEGVVGDIAPSDWDGYHYDFGLAVYHHGVLAGPDNEPLPPSQQPTDTRPLQVVTFWTQALGSAY